MKRGAGRKKRHLNQAAEELRRIEQGTPVFLENIEFMPNRTATQSLLVITRSPHERDKRNFILRWLVPSREKRSIRLDTCGTYFAGLINGQTSTLEIVDAFIAKFRVPREQAVESCLLFLHSLARRGVVAIIEKETRRKG